MPGQNIYYRTGAQIDRKRWDACMNGAQNGLIYAYSFYLDAMADHWDALILNEYEAVFPLPWRKRYGIYYLYQPFLTAQLGLFANEVDASLLQAFLRAIPAKFKLWEFSLNPYNVFSLSSFDLKLRVNYVLNLAGNYDILYRGYRENSRRNIRKALQYGCRVQKDIPVDTVVSLNREYAPGDTPDETDYRRFKSLYEQLKGRGEAITYGVYLNDRLVSSCCFFFSHKRAYYILVGNHPNGRTVGASHLLIDSFIRDHAGSGMVLDFEGSDVRNLAFFYSSFGARAEQYPAITYNHLPWYVRLFKGNSWLKNGNSCSGSLYNKQIFILL